MCCTGRLDLGRAELLADIALKFANPDDIARFAAEMDEFIAKYDDPDSPLCTITRTQLQRAAWRRKHKYRQKSQDETFAAAFKKRKVTLRPGEDGIGALGVRTIITDAMTADYRLTLIAKQIQQDNPDETRTLEQLRADLAIDLLLGKLEVTASNAHLEATLDPDHHHDQPDTSDHGPDGEDGEDGDSGESGGRQRDETGDENPEGTGDGNREAGDRTGDAGEVLFRYHKVGAYARPIINVTVPISTLLGLSEDSGHLSGAIPIPADLVRMIANRPDATWYRMLTDPARRCAELSTTAYKPTPPIWRQVTARDQICYWPGCHRPAVRCEEDHRLPWPEGDTCTGNIGPGCKQHHTVKHSKGFSVERNPDGSYTWTTPTGHKHISWPPEQPTAEWPDPENFETDYVILDDIPA